MKKLIGAFTLLFLIAIGYKFFTQKNRLAPDTPASTSTEKKIENKAPPALVAPATGATALTKIPALENLEKNIKESIPSNWNQRLEFNIQPIGDTVAKVFWTLDGRPIHRSDRVWKLNITKNRWQAERSLQWLAKKPVEEIREPREELVKKKLNEEFTQFNINGRIVKIEPTEWDLNASQELNAILSVRIQVLQNGLSPINETWRLNAETLEVIKKFPAGRHGRPRDSLIRLRSDSKP